MFKLSCFSQSIYCISFLSVRVNKTLELGLLSIRHRTQRRWEVREKPKTRLDQSWYPQSFSGSKLHPNLEPDQLGGWSGQHDGVIGIHNYVVQLYTVLDNIQFSFFLNSTSIKLSFGKIYV